MTFRGTQDYVRRLKSDNWGPWFECSEPETFGVPITSDPSALKLDLRRSASECQRYEQEQSEGLRRDSKPSH